MKRNATKNQQSQASLEKVRKQFQGWRKNKGKSPLIPEALWNAAVELHPQHSICEIAKVLRLSHTRLKRRILDAEGKKTKDTSLMVAEKRPNATASCQAEASLEEVRRQFEYWRRNKGKSRVIPEALWKAAVELHPQHSIHEIAKVLGLKTDTLQCRTWDAAGEKLNEGSALSAEKRGNGNLAFLQFDIAGRSPTQTEWSVEMEKRDGSKMRICSKSAQMPDFPEMCQNFLRARL